MRRGFIAALMAALFLSVAQADTHTSAATGDFSVGATWVGGVAPVDADAFVIANTHVVTFDMDQSAWVGMAASTINEGGTLIADTAAGAYYLKMAGNITVNGTLQAGTSVAVPYPSTCTFTIDFTSGGRGIVRGTTGNVLLYCTQPTNQYVTITEDLDVVETEFDVDTNLTGDGPWNIASAQVRIVDSTPLDSEIRTLSAVGATSITVTVALTNAKSANSIAVLVTRNIRIINVGGTTYAVTYSPSTAGTNAADHWGCEFNTVYRAIYYGIGYEFSGTAEITSTVTINGSAQVVHSGALVGATSGTTYGHSTGHSVTFSGLLAGFQVATNTLQNVTITGKVFGNSQAIQGSYHSVIPTSADISYNSYAIIASAELIIYADLLNNTNAITNSSGITAANITFDSTTSNLNAVGHGKLYNCVFGAGTEFSNYTNRRLASAYLESYNHDGVDSAFTAWCVGGIVTSQTSSPPSGYTIWYEHACEDASYSVFRQFQATVLPGTSIEVSGKIRIADGEDLTANPPALQIIDFFADPLVDPTEQPLDEDEIPEPDGGVNNDWQDVSVIWANQADYPRIVLVRMIASHASADVDEVWSIAGYQDQIAAIYNKLPTNYIMGSSVQSDKDDEIDAILEDTGTTIPGLIAALPSSGGIADAVWDEAMAGHTGEATFGGELQTLDPNITLILADTNDLQTWWADSGRLDLLIDAIKAMTDLIAVVTTTVSEANDANSFTITAGLDVNDAYWMHIIMVEDATDSHREVRFLEEWLSTRVVLVDEPFGFTPDVGDAVWIMGTGYGGLLYEIRSALAASKQPVYYYDTTTGGGRGGAGGTSYYDQTGDDP